MNRNLSLPLTADITAHRYEKFSDVTLTIAGTSSLSFELHKKQLLRCGYFSDILLSDPDTKNIELSSTFKWSVTDLKAAIDCVYGVHDEVLYAMRHYTGANIREVAESIGD